MWLFFCLKAPGDYLLTTFWFLPAPWPCPSGRGFAGWPPWAHRHGHTPNGLSCRYQEGQYYFPKAFTSFSCPSGKFYHSFIISLDLLPANFSEINPQKKAPDHSGALFTNTSHLAWCSVANIYPSRSVVIVFPKSIIESSILLFFIPLYHKKTKFIFIFIF